MLNVRSNCLRPEQRTQSFDQRRQQIINLCWAIRSFVPWVAARVIGGALCLANYPSLRLPLFPPPLCPSHTPPQRCQRNQPFGGQCRPTNLVISLLETERVCRDNPTRLVSVCLIVCLSGSISAYVCPNRLMSVSR